MLANNISDDIYVSKQTLEHILEHGYDDNTKMCTHIPVINEPNEDRNIDDNLIAICNINKIIEFNTLNNFIDEYLSKINNLFNKYYCNGLKMQNRLSRCSFCTIRRIGHFDKSTPITNCSNYNNSKLFNIAHEKLNLSIKSEMKTPIFILDTNYKNTYNVLMTYESQYIVTINSKMDYYSIKCYINNKTIIHQIVANKKKYDLILDLNGYNTQVVQVYFEFTQLIYPLQEFYPINNKVIKYDYHMDDDNNIIDTFRAFQRSLRIKEFKLRFIVNEVLNIVPNIRNLFHINKILINIKNVDYFNKFIIKNCEIIVKNNESINKIKGLINNLNVNDNNSIKNTIKHMNDLIGHNDRVCELNGINTKHSNKITEFKSIIESNIKYIDYDIKFNITTNAEYLSLFYKIMTMFNKNEN